MVALQLRRERLFSVQPVPLPSQEAGLHHVVGAIAEGRIIRALAAAEIERAGSLGDEADRQKGCALVTRGIAEGLAGGASALAPQIGSAFLELDLIRPELSDHGFI
jgi:hypothetical protein